MTSRRLIESAFPLKQASLDSVHEKSVRHGHISTLHIWPARRPLAASRAALLAMLLLDPDDGPEKRQKQRELLRQMAGRVVDKIDRDGEVTGETTDGGILHWGRESASKPRHTSSARARDDKRPNDAPGNAAAHFHPLARFRKKIADAFDGRPPRVLDPFAGGGAIPLEAMRLGCEVVVSDLNPVAWFILRCTLHYPHLLAGRKRALPDFALDDEAFMAAFFRAQGVAGQRALREALDAVGNRGGGKSASDAGSTGLLPMKVDAEADFAWHLRAWGRRALAEARRQLASRYPAYAEFEPVPPPAGKERRERRRGQPDANDDLGARWQAIGNRLHQMKVQLPTQPEHGGTIIDSEPRVGVWLMPNNAMQGELENFVAELVPKDDPVWPLAQQYIDGIPSEHRLFSSKKELRAKIHAWLATREEPRKMGAAIGRAELDAEAPIASQFVDWLRTLFASRGQEP